jgi:hypothetical protein
MVVIIGAGGEGPTQKSFLVLRRSRCGFSCHSLQGPVCSCQEVFRAAGLLALSSPISIRVKPNEGSPALEPHSQRSFRRTLWQEGPSEEAGKRLQRRGLGHLLHTCQPALLGPTQNLHLSWHLGMGKLLIGQA